MTRAVLASLCLLAACTPRPADPAALADVLVELHLLEARQQQVRDVPTTVRDSILARHGFTPEQFASTIADLNADLERATQVYTGVLTRLDSLSYDPLDRLARDR